MAGRATIVSLDRDPCRADAALVRPGRRVARLEDGIDGSPGTIVGVVGPGQVCRVVEAALQGWDLVVRLDLHGEARRLALEDLRRIGDLIEPGGTVTPVLDPVDDELIECLAGGATVAQAARQVGLSDRTAARRLVVLRQAYEVDTTAGLVARWQAAGR